MSCQNATNFAIMDAKGVIIMAKTVSRYISELLQTYQETTRKTYAEIALEFDVTISNLYLYRNEEGNPRAKTVDKIVGGVEAQCPEALKKMNASG